jgi:molybdopterin converting factor small subunit
MSRCSIIFSGSLQDKTGCEETFAEIGEDTTLKELHELTLNRFPALKGQTYTIASEESYLKQSDRITENQKIYFMPPFAGG